MFTKTKIELAKPCVEAIKKIAKAKGKKWEWEPERGEWFIYKKRIYLLTDIREKGKFLGHFVYDDTYGLHREIGEVTPLLHWEKLEKIMEGLGYSIHIGCVGDMENWHWKPKEFYKARLDQKFCYIPKNEILTIADTRQEAVMRAIIKLGEEIDDSPEPDLSKVFKPQIVCKFPERKERK